jgi:hypothetical protein
MINAGAILLLALCTAGGCVSADRYRDLQTRYEHVLDAKLDMDRDYAESRRELLAVQEQHAKLAGEIAALGDAVQAKIQTAVGPVAAEVAKLQAERTAALRDRAREETAREDSRRLLLERLDRLSADLDRLADRLTRVEVVAARPPRPPAEAAKPKAKATAAAGEAVEPAAQPEQPPLPIPPPPLGATAVPRAGAAPLTLP